MLKINIWLLLSIFVALVSFIIGLYMNWYPKDMLADIARYVAPFLGFAVGICIFRRLSYNRIIDFIIILVVIELFFYYYSLFEKIRYVYTGGSIIEYAKYGLHVSGFFFLLFTCFLRKRILSRIGKILIVGYIIGFVFGPIMLMSKARLLAHSFLFTLVFLFVFNKKVKLIFLVLSLIFIVVAITYVESNFYSHIFSRFYDMVNFVQSGDYTYDVGTDVRIAEIINVKDALFNNLPFSAPFGMGSGALWFETVRKVMGGLHAGNFSDNGGLHHIFMASISILFRYGIIGFGIILLWIANVMKKLINALKRTDGNPFDYSIYLSVLFYIFYALLSDTFVPVYMYGNIYFGFILAVGYVVAGFNYRYKTGLVQDPVKN